MSTEKPNNKRKVYLKGSKSYKSLELWQLSDLTDWVEKGVEIETSLSDKELMDFLEKMAQTSGEKRLKAIERKFGAEIRGKIENFLNEKTVGMSLVVVDEKSSKTSVMTRDITVSDAGVFQESIDITPRKEGEEIIWQRGDNVVQSDQLIFPEAYNDLVNQPLPQEPKAELTEEGLYAELSSDSTYGDDRSTYIDYNRAHQIQGNLQAIRDKLSALEHEELEREFVEQLYQDKGLIRNMSFEVRDALLNKEGYDAMDTKQFQDEVSKRVTAAIWAIQDIREETKTEREKVESAVKILASPDLPKWAQEIDSNDDLYERWSKDLVDIKTKVKDLYPEKPEPVVYKGVESENMLQQGVQGYLSGGNNSQNPENGYAEPVPVLENDGYTDIPGSDKRSPGDSLPPTPQAPPLPRRNGEIKSNELEKAQEAYKEDQGKKIIRQKSSVQEPQKDRKKFQNVVKAMIEYAKAHDASIEDAILKERVLAAIRSKKHPLEHLKGERGISRKKSKDFDGFNDAFYAANEELSGYASVVDSVDSAKSKGAGKPIDEKSAAKVKPFVKTWKKNTPGLDTDAVKIKDMFKKVVTHEKSADLMDSMFAYAWNHANGDGDKKTRVVKQRFRAAFFSKGHQIEYLKGERNAEDKIKGQPANKLDAIDKAYEAAEERFKIKLVEKEKRDFEASLAGIIKREFSKTKEADRIAQIQNGNQIKELVSYVKDHLPKGVEDTAKEIEHRIIAFAQEGDLGLLNGEEDASKVEIKKGGLTDKATFMKQVIKDWINQQCDESPYMDADPIPEPNLSSPDLASDLDTLISLASYYTSSKSGDISIDSIRNRILAYYQEKDLDFLDGTSNASDIKIKMQDTSEFKKMTEILDRKLNSKFLYMEMNSVDLDAQEPNADKTLPDSDTESERSNSVDSRTSSVSSRGSLKSKAFPEEVAEKAVKLGRLVGESTTDGPPARTRSASLSAKGSQKQNPSGPRFRAQTHDPSKSRDPSRRGHEI